jgi:SAM-dependent methyltransferase
VHDWSKQAKMEWNKLSENWQKNSAEMWESGSRKPVLPLFLKYVSKEKGPLLDAGCGDGYASLMLVKNGFDVIGVDLSDEMIAKAKARAAQDRATVSFQVADICRLPFSAQTFQAILSINAIEWVKSPLAALKEFHRVLKEDGILCLGILGPTAAPREHSYRRHYDEPVIQNTLMPWEAGRLFQENGFTLLDQCGVYKRGVTDDMVTNLSTELKQALSFLWLFIFQRTKSN